MSDTTGSDPTTTSTPTPEPPGLGEMETLSQVMTRRRDEGWEADFDAGPDGLVCGTCGATVAAADVTIDATHRFEGASNPDDESVLFALTGPCGDRGLYSAPYGPDATADDARVMTELTHRSIAG